MNTAFRYSVCCEGFLYFPIKTFFLSCLNWFCPSDFMDVRQRVEFYLPLCGSGDMMRLKLGLFLQT